MLKRIRSIFGRLLSNSIHATPSPNKIRNSARRNLSALPRSERRRRRRRQPAGRSQPTSEQARGRAAVRTKLSRIRSEVSDLSTPTQPTHDARARHADGHQTGVKLIEFPSPNDTHTGFTGGKERRRAKKKLHPPASTSTDGVCTITAHPVPSGWAPGTSIDQPGTTGQGVGRARAIGSEGAAGVRSEVRASAWSVASANERRRGQWPAVGG